MRITPRPPVAPHGDPAQAKAWKTAQSFEAQFLKSMLEQAFKGLDGEGPLGAAGAGGDAWRSFLIEEHAGAIARRGGIGLASEVYRVMRPVQGSRSDVRA